MELSNGKQHSEQYDKFSRVIHWLTAVVVVIGFMLGPEDFGRLMHRGIDPATRSDIVWHESLGLTIFLLTCLRLIWVVLRPAAPRFPMAMWMHLSARMVQVALWLLLISLPLTALLALGSEAHPLTLLGGVRVNEFPWIAGTWLADMADWGEVHKLLGDVIIWLAGLHALAALYHHVKLKDRVLKSMLP